MQRTIIVNSNCYHGHDIFRAIDGIKKAGFRNIELTCTKGWTEHVFPTHSFKEIQKVKDYLEKNDISVIGFSGHCNLMDEERLEDFIDNIDLAAFFKARYIVSSVGEAHLKDKKEVGDDDLVKNLNTLLPYLEKYNLILVIEVHGEHGRASRIKEITKKVNSDRVKICYDTANAIFYGGVEGCEDLEAAVDEVRYLHIKDKKGDPKEWNFPALGEGYVDFPALFDVLDRNNNDSPLSIEIEFTEKGSESAEEVDAALVQSARYLKGLGYNL